jgi:GR25 family glycosyltransferase involved in LPS biosynthesis
MKYTIIHVNDRAIENIEKNKSILSEFEYVSDIDFFNGNTGNAWDVINHIGIRQDVWLPYDGRTSPPLPGELGIWVSTINVLQYMIDNKIDQMLVLEDDVVLKSDFIKKLSNCLNELPKTFDFLSLYYFKDQNKVTEATDVGLKNIHKSYNQYSAAQATLYSFAGAKKILKLIFSLVTKLLCLCVVIQELSASNITIATAMVTCGHCTERHDS